MNYLYVLIFLTGISNSQINTGKDSSHISRFFKNSKIGLNFGYGYNLYPKGDINKVDATSEYNRMLELSNPNISVANYNNPNDLCYVYSGSLLSFLGTYIRTPIHFRKFNFDFLTGIYFQYGKSTFNTSIKLRKEVYNLHVDYLNSRGLGSSLESYNMDTTSIKKIYSGYFFSVPISIIIPILKRLEFEAGGKFEFFDHPRETYVSEFGTETIYKHRFAPYLGGYFSLNYTISKYLSFQLGYTPRRIVFASIRLNIKS